VNYFEMQGRIFRKIISETINKPRDQRIFRWGNFVKLVFKELYNKFGIILRGKDMRFM